MGWLRTQSYQSRRNTIFVSKNFLSVWWVHAQFSSGSSRPCQRNIGFQKNKNTSLTFCYSLLSKLHSLDWIRKTANWTSAMEASLRGGTVIMLCKEIIRNYSLNHLHAYTNLIILEASLSCPCCTRLSAANTLHCAARTGFPNLMATINWCREISPALSDCNK